MINKNLLEEYKADGEVLVNELEALRLQREAFDEANKSLIEHINSLRVKQGDTKLELKLQAIEDFKASGEKKLLGGIGIRVGSTLEYDEAEALSWAKEHKLCLKLDSRSFERLAKSQEFTFVDKEEKVTVTFPKEIII